MPVIAVFTDHPELLENAKALASQLQLPFQATADFLLTLTPDYLGLQQTGEKNTPLYINFVSGKLNYRRHHLGIQREALARAMGLKKNTQPSILDATAGLARDSFVIAALGFSIRLIERSPIIHALIQDGMQRALKNAETAPIIQRMQLIQADAITYLQELTEKPDIIYLDPMFPERKKTALSKLDMRLFHAVIGEDIDADLLLKNALACAARRVVVKRPRLAMELAGIKPSFSLSGSSSRFDIYLI
jgi:16S rRNA (guanine1516-N2)-methyltransferase